MAFSFFNDLKTAVLDLISSVSTTVSDVLTIKSIAQDEFDQLEADFKKATDDLADFAERVRNLRSHVIRADVAFEIIDDIRKVNIGSLKQQIADLKSSIFDQVTEFINEGQSVGVVRTSGPITIIQKIISFIKSIGAAWKLIAFITHALRALPPIADAIVKQLEHFESIVMPQTKPEVKKDGPHRTRKG